MRHTIHRETCAQDCGYRASVRWLPCFVLVVLLAMIPSCKQASTDLVPAQSEAVVEPNIATAEIISPSQSADEPEFVEQKLEDLTSSFTKETVLALNAIVSRSLSAIERFDEARRDFNNDSDDAQRVEILATYTELSNTTRQARKDMDAAAKRLRNSGEHYNEAIFAAMVEFVNKVDNEIHAEIAGL